jgi:Fe-Mn family superoxide dismutase
MPFAVPPLAYGYDALEPTIDEQTMRLHHDKHHQGYADKLNGVIAGTEWDGRPVDEILANLSAFSAEQQTVVRNNGGGHLNHSLFWEAMSPDGGGEPAGELAAAIRESFGSFEGFKEQFDANGVAQFGSGWTWLSREDGRLMLERTPNQDSPVLSGHTPLLGNDVWEHAYYLTYQNRRPEYLQAWWSVVDWRKVAERYAAAR